MKNQNQCAVYYHIILEASPTPLTHQKTLAMQILRHAFAEFFGTKLMETCIKRTPNGKPYYEATKNLFFNISHCNAAVAVAVAHTPVGVDIESPRPVKSRTVEKCCTSEEMRYIYASSLQSCSQNLTPEQAARFLNLWTLKESYVKMTGEGLRTPFNQISFDIPNFQKSAPDTLQYTLSKQYHSWLCHKPPATIALTLPQIPQTSLPTPLWIPYTPETPSR